MKNKKGLEQENLIKAEGRSKKERLKFIIHMLYLSN